MQDLGQVTGAAPEIHDAPTRDGVAQGEQVVERLLAFRSEALVLVGAPPVDRSHGHRRHVYSVPRRSPTAGRTPRSQSSADMGERLSGCTRSSSKVPPPVATIAPCREPGGRPAAPSSPGPSATSSTVSRLPRKVVQA